MSTTNRFSGALKPFLIVAGLGLAALAVDQYRTRPLPMPKPAAADSLAGVLARLFPGTVDSAGVGKITWRQAREGVLRWAPSSEYDYRGQHGSREVSAIIAQAELDPPRITFAVGHADVETVKHEMAHLLLHDLTHPPAAFQRLEAYRGR